jgi:ribosome-associated protein
MEDVTVTANLTIPGDELHFRASRSSGPGGQGVNTTSSRIELRWDVSASEALDPEQRALLLERLGPRLTADGVLILHGSEHRSQHRNREAVRARLKAIVAEAVTPVRARRATRPTRASARRRAESKIARSSLKGLRKGLRGRSDD